MDTDVPVGITAKGLLQAYRNGSITLDEWLSVCDHYSQLSLQRSKRVLTQENFLEAGD